MDPISIKQTAALCAEALTSDSSLDPVYGTLLPVGSPRSDVRAVSIVMYTVFGEHFKFGPADMPASKEDFEFGKKFYSLTERLVAQVSQDSLFGSGSLLNQLTLTRVVYVHMLTSLVKGVLMGYFRA